MSIRMSLFPDSKKMYEFDELLLFVEVNELCRQIAWVNNEFSHSNVITAEQVFSRKERIYILFDEYNMKVTGQIFVLMFIDKYKNHDRGEIGRLAIVPTFRGMGYSSFMLSYVVDEMIRNGEIRFAHAWIADNNIPSMALFRGNRFIPTRIVKVGKVSGREYRRWIHRSNTETDN